MPTTRAVAGSCPRPHVGERKMFTPAFRISSIAFGTSAGFSPTPRQPSSTRCTRSPAPPRRARSPSHSSPWPGPARTHRGRRPLAGSLQAGVLALAVVEEAAVAVDTRRRCPWGRRGRCAHGVEVRVEGGAVRALHAVGGPQHLGQAVQIASRRAACPDGWSRSCRGWMDASPGWRPPCGKRGMSALATATTSSPSGTASAPPRTEVVLDVDQEQSLHDVLPRRRSRLAAQTLDELHA